MRTGEITRQQADGLIDLFEQDYENYAVIRVDSGLIRTAKLLIQEYSDKGLRTLDSIQSASLIKEKENIVIAKTSDMRLKEIIRDYSEIIINLPRELLALLGSYQISNALH